MLISPRDLLAFGELFLNGGESAGNGVVPHEWIERSWIPRARYEALTGLSNQLP